MATVTPLDIITQSLKKAGIIGIGQTPNAEDVNDAFLDLNDMIAQWSRKRWIVYHLIDISIVSTGALFYTVGPGGDFDTPRPDRLESAFFRQLVQSQPNQVDYPLEIIQARENYNQIALKSLQTFPQYIFYDSGFPVGKVYPWPVPQSNIYEIHITLKQTLTQFTTLNEAIILPPEYMAALKWNLALRMLVSYPGTPDNPKLVGLARDSLNVIRGANTQIAALTMPPDIVGGRSYNVYSDGY